VRITLPGEHTEDARGIGAEKAKFLCPHCHVFSLHVHASIKFAPRVDEKPTADGGRLVITTSHLLYTCVNCQNATYFLQEQRTVHSALLLHGDRQSATVGHGKVLHQYPLAIPSLHQSVPDPVKQAIIEAEKCLAVGAPNACGTMARRAIHSVCEDKKATGENLYKQLESLRVSGTITDDIWEWASDLRIIGRDGAHPEWPEVSPEDADYAVRFLHEIIRYVYINPWERTQRRGTKSKAQPATDTEPSNLS
jgi:hypothetical protein